MRPILLMIPAALLMLLCACGGQTGDPGLLARLPQGYDAYMTVDPEKAELAEILEIVEDNLSEYDLDEIEDADLGIDVFDWDEWKDELGIEPGEIGVVGLGEDMEFLALFLPCGDGEKLEDFVDEAGGGDEVEFLEMDEYTVMVIAWEDDDQIDDLEDALEDEPLSGDRLFNSLAEKTVMADVSVGFLFYEEITEFPVMGFVSSREDETELSFALVLEDDEIAEYSHLFGDGLQSSSIMFPENTMAAVRTTMDMEMLAEQYEDIADQADTDVEDVETGLAFIGFDSMEEFIGAFRGDYCIALSELELDDWGEPSGGAGVMALSLTDGEKLESSLNMISSLAEAHRESFDDYTAYRIDVDREEIWYFVCDDVLYVSYNIDPEDVTDGMKASDFFTGASSEGFMGGAANPELLADGISLDHDAEEIIEEVFSSGDAAFSISMDGEIAFSRITVGPGVITALVSVAMEMQ